MFNCLTQALPSDMAAAWTGVTSNTRIVPKLFKMAQWETVNKENSLWFSTLAQESVSFLLTTTCGTEKSFFCAVVGSIFELTPQDQEAAAVCFEVGFAALFLLLQSWSFLVCQPAGMTHGSLSQHGKVFPEEFQLLQAFAKEILNWIRFIILIC